MHACIFVQTSCRPPHPTTHNLSYKSASSCINVSLELKFHERSPLNNTIMTDTYLLFIKMMPNIFIHADIATSVDQLVACSPVAGSCRVTPIHIAAE